MSIFKAKYQVHRFVNYIFYFIVFAFGLLVGLGFNNEKIRNAFSNFLFIDTAYAYTIYEDENVIYDEEFIYNMLSTNENFDLDIFPYISCTFSSVGSNRNLGCSAFSEEGLSHFKFYAAGGRQINFTTLGGTFRVINMGISGGSFYTHDNGVYSFDGSLTTYPDWGARDFSVFNTSSYKSYSNFDYTLFPDTSSSSVSSIFNYNYNVLDFSAYSIPEMVYDEDLFANDNNFKEVCVNNYDTFSITSNNYNYNSEHDFRYYSKRDSIWFKNYIYGLESTFYKDPDSISTPSFYDNVYYFDSVDNINEIYNTTGLSYIYNEGGYTDKYSYYGYSSHLFDMGFSNETDNSINYFNIFHFNNAYIEDLDGNKTYPGQFCFYIKNEYDINILNENTIDSIGGGATVLGGGSIDYHIDIDRNIRNYEYHDLRSSITSFITQMFPTIHTININIYHLYLSMPELVRLFVISLITLIFIRFILKLVMK